LLKIRGGDTRLTADDRRLTAGEGVAGDGINNVALRLGLG